MAHNEIDVMLLVWKRMRGFGWILVCKLYNMYLQYLQAIVVVRMKAIIGTFFGKQLKKFKYFWKFQYKNWWMKKQCDWISAKLFVEIQQIMN